jgi:uncharacterized protein YbjT (DUF2867 family)
MQRVLVAGATGELGRFVVKALQARGCWVRALSRSAERAASLGANEVAIGDATRPEQLAQACAGIERVFSCLGQSVGADMANRGPGYHAVDYVGNHNLLVAAKQAGVERFAYVSVFKAEAFPRVAYMRAHADVAAELRASGLSYAIIQPTGFFSAFGAFFEMARRGSAVVFGSGNARTNPIDDRDLASLCCDATLADERGELAAGGPDVLTRREVIELAFAALGKPPRIMSAPAWAPFAIGAIARPLAPRIGELMAFFGAVGGQDLVAPTRGQRRLADYYAALARG